jgi:putative Holliday junction resolvase
MKRCGIAVTDILKISNNPVEVLHPDKLLAFLKSYIEKEDVEKLLIGWPTHPDGKETYLVTSINEFLISFAKLFPKIEIIKVDESFSSSEAKEIIFRSEVKKKKRRNKALVDQMSAVIIIKRYLEGL